MLSKVLSVCSRFGFRNVSKCVAIRRNPVISTRAASQSTVDNQEVHKFTSNADEWWTEQKVLQSMNALRVPLVRDGILSLDQKVVRGPSPLKGYKIIDVGCGGGLLSEPLARLGASVTGLDPGRENIDIAIAHASEDEEIKDRLTYICDSVENIAVSSPGLYDAVVCSEVIEHVADVQLFLNSCVEITKCGGSLFFTTINRTILSYAIAIVGAEYVTQIIDRGTHDWNKFIAPKELSNMLQTLNCRIVCIQGTMYNPILKKWNWSRNTDVCYALHACK